MLRFGLGIFNTLVSLKIEDKLMPNYTCTLLGRPVRMLTAAGKRNETLDFSNENIILQVGLFFVQVVNPFADKRLCRERKCK